MTILIITRTSDNQCIPTVTRAVEERGGRVFRLDTDRFPTDVRLGVRQGAGLAGRFLECDGVRLDLDEVTGVWHRRLHVGGGLPDDLDAQIKSASVGESRRALLNAVTCIDAFVMDPLVHIRRAENKELQLRLAERLGIDTPRTLVTNDPTAVRAFADECGGDVITKMQSSFAIHEDGREKVVFTNPLSRADLDELEGLDLCPMVFQERLEKRLELRVTVVGERVFAASIDSAAREDARHDWRRRGLEMLGDWKTFELPADLERRVLALQDVLGLNYGAADFILTPEGRFVFLEVNPVGEFFWLERVPGFPLSEAIADVLLGRAPRREQRELLAGAELSPA
ncbi:MAG: MvdC/MvdD family ATP grasp protein [Planctomycetota bacterium]